MHNTSIVHETHSSLQNVVVK